MKPIAVLQKNTAYVFLYEKEILENKPFKSGLKQTALPQGKLFHIKQNIHDILKESYKELLFSDSVNKYWVPVFYLEEFEEKQISTINTESNDLDDKLDNVMKMLIDIKKQLSC